jgi:hypothetical protein
MTYACGSFCYFFYGQMCIVLETQTRDDIDWRWSLSCVHAACHDGIFDPALLVHFLGEFD